MTFVWVIVGKSGFWKERRWNVTVISDEEKAEQYISKLNYIVKEEQEKHGDVEELKFNNLLNNKVKHLDPYVDVEDGVLEYVKDKVYLTYSDSSFNKIISKEDQELENVRF